MGAPERAAERLDVLGQLSIVADDTPVEVEFSGAVVRVAVADLRAARRLGSQFGRVERRSLLRSLQEVLVRSGLELEFRVGDSPVGRLTAASRGNAVSRWLGMDPVEIKLGSFLGAVRGQAKPPNGR